jgi:micrococcal nuclease
MKALTAGLMVLSLACVERRDRDDSYLTVEGPDGPAGATQACTVARVIDGDTVECDGIGRIRLIGMDTPEADQEPFGAIATRALTALIPPGSDVEVERDVEPRDQYDRVLAYVWTNGLMVNWAMVRQGYAVVLTYPPNVRYAGWFTAAQQRARTERSGLWAAGGFECLPRDRRRGDC